MDMKLLNPRGRNLYPLIGTALARTYGFTAPGEYDEQKGVPYLGGEFSPTEAGTDVTGVKLMIFHNGIVAQTSTTTRDTDLFLERMLKMLTHDKIVAFRPEMVKQKWYATELVVRPSVPLRALADFNVLYKGLKEMVYPDNAEAQFEIAGFVFDVDQALPRKQVPFTFQRRIGFESSENLYYSHGPFSTEQHQRVLKTLEACLKSLPKS
jgi:hypothetical protein